MTDVTLDLMGRAERAPAVWHAVRLGGALLRVERRLRADLRGGQLHG